MNEVVQRLAGVVKGITQSKKKISLLAKSFNCNLYTQNISKKSKV